MSYNKKDLLEAKKKLEETSPGYLKSIRKTKNKPKKRIIKKDDFKKKNAVCEWNFKINELVYIKHHSEGSSIALIVGESGKTFLGERITQNCYYVLFENRTFEVTGSYLKKII
jgi:hypothetical protein